MKKGSIKLSVLFGIPLCCLLLSGGMGDAAEKQKKIRLAYAEWGLGSAVSYVGIDGGIFKKFHIDVEELFMRDALSGGIHALTGADMLVGFGNPLSIIRPILGGADLVLLGSHISNEKYGMLVSKDISTVKELKGLKVGVSSLGGRSDLAARTILRRAGLNPVSDVEIVIAGVSANRAAAVSKDLIQGTPLNMDRSALAKKIGLKVLELKDIPLVTSLLISTKSFIKKDEELVRQYVKAYVTSIHFYLTRRKESIEIIGKYFSGTSRESLENMYEAFASQLTPVPVLNPESLQAFIDATHVTDRRAVNLKPEKIVDDRFLKELEGSGYVDQMYRTKVTL